MKPRTLSGVLRSEAGATSVEYGLIAGLVAVVVIAFLFFLEKT